MHKFISAAALLSISCSTAHAGPNTPAQYTRIGPWEINYDRDSCHLQAQFDADDGLKYASFTRYEPAAPKMRGQLELTLYGKRLELNGRQKDATLDFGVGAPLTVPVNAGLLGSLPVGIFRFAGYAMPDSPEDDTVDDDIDSRVTGLTVKIYGRSAFHLEFGSLSKPMAALHACTEDLVKTWGFDPKVQAALKEKPKPRTPPRSWISDDDYPSPAVRTGVSGLIQFRLNVDADGNVSECHVLARTQPDLFSDVTCRALMRNAKFEPAIDVAGNPVASYFVGGATFQLAH